jgi:HAD superfamily hydrolase (TIGR01509 family)
MSVKEPRGVIFDLDGVISDTQDMHSHVESEFLRSLGIEIHPDNITARFAGVGDKEMFSTIFAEYGVDHPIEEISVQKWKMMEDQVQKHGIKPISHVVDLIESLYNSNFILAIASGSPRNFINQVMGALSLRKFFAVSVSSDEVERGKPAPDVFLEAARQANMDLSKCTIIEDGLSGMQAAAAAKISCVGLVKDKTKIYPADLLITSFNQLTVDMICQLQNKQNVSLPLV